VHWSGVSVLPEAESVRLGAFVSGNLSVTIDGATVLKGEGKELTSWLKGRESFQREPGLYSITIDYDSRIGRAPARVQLWWEGKSFAREPIPAPRFKHLATQEHDLDFEARWA